jgi:hypothetical protein
VAASVATVSTLAEIATVSPATFVAPTGIADGDLLIIWFFEFSVALPVGYNITRPAGFADMATTNVPGGAWPVADPSAAYNQYCFSKVASGESGNYQVSWTGGTTRTVRGIMARITGAKATTPFTPDPTFRTDPWGSGETDVITTFTGLTTTVDNTLILGFASDDNDKHDELTPPTGTTPTFSEVVDDLHGNYLCSGVMSPAGPTGDKTMANNSNGGVNYFSGLVAVQPSLGTGTVTAASSDAIPVTDIAQARVATSSIAVTDLEYHLSTNAGSLGGAIAGTIAGGAANNVWDDVTAGESSSGDTEYRCVYIKNNHPTATWLAPTVWIDSSPTPDSVAIALDSAAVGATAASTSANESTAPTGGGAPYTFTSPTTKAAGLVIADIPPGQYKAIWLKRTVPSSAAANASDGISIRCEGSTPT